MALVVPALQAAELMRLGEALAIVEGSGARMVHVEVKDGHFVPEIEMGQPVVASLRKATELELDVHLMIERPERCVGDFLDAGADRLAVHAEATSQLNRALRLIRARGAAAGVALNPATSVEVVKEVLEALDFLTIVCDDPGSLPGALIRRSVAKVLAACRMRAERGLKFALQVEGDITSDNLDDWVNAGADILVADSAIFEKKGAKGSLAEMVRRCSEARQTLKV